jgi:hypothetical protein
MHTGRAVLVVAAIGCLVASPLLAQPAGGGATPAEAYKRLQKAAEARNISELVSSLHSENRAMLLGDLYAIALVLTGGVVEGMPEQRKKVEALGVVFEEVIKPVVEANPPDPALLQNLNDFQLIAIAARWGLTKMPLADALRVARVVEDSLDGLQHPSLTTVLDDYVKMVARGPLTITRETKDAIFAEADDRPIHFIRDGERWYAAAVWFDKKKFKFESLIDEKGVVTTTLTPADAPSPSGPLTAAEAYQALRAEARKKYPNARLRELQTGSYPLSADGKSELWSAQFLTGTPGEMVTVVCLGSQIIPPSTGPIHPSAVSLANEETLSYDAKRLHALAAEAAPEEMKRSTKVSAALHYSAARKEPEWIAALFGPNDTFLANVMVDPVTMKVVAVSRPPKK